MTEAPLASPSFNALLRTFGRIGLINFGGPAGQIALMQKTLVDEKSWIDGDDYLRALNFCTLLPGPEAQQLATYVGWKLHGVRGGLAAGILFVLPGAAVILALSILYVLAADLKPVAAALLGVKAAVLAIVVEALFRISKRALNAPVKRLIAVLAFIALAVFSAPFPAVVVVAGVAGFLIANRHPEALRLKPVLDQGALAPARPLIARTFATILGWLTIWALPMLGAALMLGPNHVLVAIGLFFGKLATVTFGGAYAVLAYMAQQAVTDQHWLRPSEMVDGLGLAETTPGPLILVTQYVGFIAAFRHPAPFTPLVAGVIGAAMTLWVTFTPCFLWIFAAAPWLQRLERARRLQGTLAAVTAAVVGVIANLTLWFALHVLFSRFTTARLGPLKLGLPDLMSLDWRPLVLSILAALLLFRFHLGVIRTLGCAVVGGLALLLVGAF